MANLEECACLTYEDRMIGRAGLSHLREVELKGGGGRGTLSERKELDNF